MVLPAAMKLLIYLRRAFVGFRSSVSGLDRCTAPESFRKREAPALGPNSRVSAGTIKGNPSGGTLDRLFGRPHNLRSIATDLIGNDPIAYPVDRFCEEIKNWVTSFCHAPILS